MTCQRCKSSRVASVSVKGSDMFSVSIGDEEYDGYLPGDMNLDGGDYLAMEFCLDCGQIQGTWPLPPTELELGKKADMP